jgi:hypothetical protein
MWDMLEVLSYLEFIGFNGIEKMVAECWHNEYKILMLCMSKNPAHDEVYPIQHYVIKFVSNLRQVGGFLWVHRIPPPIKLTATIYLK